MSAESRAYHVGQFRTVRCRVLPALFEESGVHWSILGLAFSPDILSNEHPERELMVLIGELSAHSEQSVVAVTVEAMVSFVDGPTMLSEDEGLLRAEIERIGGELNDVMYDSAADIARALAALTRSDVDVPNLTPHPRFDLWESSPPTDVDDHIDPVASPAELASELDVSQKRVRSFLRHTYGDLPSGVTRWQLSPDQADAVRAHFSGGIA